MLLALSLPLAACAKTESTAAQPATNVPETFFVADAPATPKTVSEVVASPKEGDQVAVTGRVGGAHKVFVENFAAFTIVDAKLAACSDNEADECKTPWDYCCESPDTMAANALSVELVTDGKLVRANPRGFHGLDHLKTVVVQGQVAKDESGNVRVLATGLHVAP